LESISRGVQNARLGLYGDNQNKNVCFVKPDMDLSKESVMLWANQKLPVTHAGLGRLHCF